MRGEIVDEYLCMSSFFSSSQLRLIAVSVGFDFSASHNGIAPLSPILFTGGIERRAFF